MSPPRKQPEQVLFSRRSVFPSGVYDNDEGSISQFLAQSKKALDTLHESSKSSGLPAARVASVLDTLVEIIGDNSQRLSSLLTTFDGLVIQPQFCGRVQATKHRYIASDCHTLFSGFCREYVHQW